MTAERPVAGPGRWGWFLLTPPVGDHRHRFSLLTILPTAGAIIATALTVGPLGVHGRSLAVLLLLIANWAVLGSRHLPPEWFSDVRRLSVLLVGVGVTAGLNALATTGAGSMLPFFVAGNAGYVLTATPAVAVAALTSVANGGVLLLHLGPGHTITPWPVGAASGAAVLLGMINRSREAAVLSSLAAAEAGERAAQAEARESILTERGRIARDVHDVLAHSLAGIGMQLEVADALLDKGDAAGAQAATRRAQSLVRDSLAEAQRTVRALRDDALPLVETITAMLASSGQPAPTVTGDVRELDTRVAQALVRVAQEALTNATRHAPGAAVTTTLRYEPASVELDVENAAPTAPAPLSGTGSGMGLVGMRERIALLEGSVTTGPTAAGGWSVRVVVPA